MSRMRISSGAAFYGSIIVQDGLSTKHGIIILNVCGHACEVYWIPSCCTCHGVPGCGVCARRQERQQAGSATGGAHPARH